jgi:hypothetical protein
MFWVVPVGTVDQTSETGGVGPLESPPHAVRISGASAVEIRARALILPSCEEVEETCTVSVVLSTSDYLGEGGGLAGNVRDRY